VSFIKREKDRKEGKRTFGSCCGYIRALKFKSLDSLGFHCNMMQKICLTVCALPLVYSVFFYIAIIFRFHFPPWLDTTVIVNTHSSSFWLLINLIIFLWRGCLVSSPVCCCFSLSPVQMSLNNVNKNNSNNNIIKINNSPYFSVNYSFAFVKGCQTENKFESGQGTRITDQTKQETRRFIQGCTVE
jgi:hypothetical protein